MSLSTTKPAPNIPPAQLESFATHLQSSQRIIAVLGAGLSASSGLPTFHGAGGLWRSHDVTQLATPGAFKSDPALVWQFYNYRRHMALNAEPNRAHYALAELSRRKSGFITLSQNVDRLSQKAGHPASQLKLLHGNLFDVRCGSGLCDYVRTDDLTDPIVPALAILEDKSTKPRQMEGKANAKPLVAARIAQQSALIRGLDISDARVPLSAVPRSSLPHCPQCEYSLLRPGVVWFGETLPDDVLTDIESFFNGWDPTSTGYGDGQPTMKVDLCLVIGTSSTVYPAGGYANIARSMGARVAVVNMDPADARHLQDGDWFFEGDAAQIVPEILKSVIGEVFSRSYHHSKIFL